MRDGAAHDMSGAWRAGCRLLKRTDTVAATLRAPTTTASHTQFGTWTTSLRRIFAPTSERILASAYRTAWNRSTTPANSTHARGALYRPPTTNAYVVRRWNQGRGADECDGSVCEPRETSSAPRSCPRREQRPDPLYLHCPALSCICRHFAQVSPSVERQPLRPLDLPSEGRGFRHKRNVVRLDVDQLRPRACTEGLVTALVGVSLQVRRAPPPSPCPGRS
jgi:hypothetical protein